MRPIVYLLSVISVCILMGCGDDGNPGSTSRICYDKPLGYDDVCTQNSQYYSAERCSEWLSGSYDEETARYDPNYTLVTRECVEGVVYED